MSGGNKIFEAKVRVKLDWMLSLKSSTKSWEGHLSNFLPFQLDLKVGERGNS